MKDILFETVYKTELIEGKKGHLNVTQAWEESHCIIDEISMVYDDRNKQIKLSLCFNVTLEINVVDILS